MPGKRDVLRSPTTARTGWKWHTPGLCPGQVFQLHLGIVESVRHDPIGIVIVGVVVALFPAALESALECGRIARRSDRHQAAQRRVGAETPVAAVLMGL